jgi:hypothetical protein
MDLLHLILTVGAMLSIGLLVFLLYTKKSQAERCIICRDCYNRAIGYVNAAGYGNEAFTYHTLFADPAIKVKGI